MHTTPSSQACPACGNTASRTDAQATIVGRSMGSDRRLVSPICFTENRRQATVPAARLPGRHHVDPSQWSTMERFTKMFTFASDLLASPAMQGRIGVVRRDVAPPVAAFRRPAENRLDRSVGGWHIRSRKKGGRLRGKNQVRKRHQDHGPLRR